MRFPFTTATHHRFQVVSIVVATLTAAPFLVGAPFGPPTPIFTGISPESCLHVTDIDRDGDGDVLVASAGGKLDLLRRGAGGAFSRQSVIDGGVVGVLRVVTADFDLDGRKDIAAYLQRDAQTTVIRILRQNIYGGFLNSSANDIVLGAAPAPQAPLRLADLNRDGRPDLVTAWQTAATGAGKGRISWLRNTGGGSFSSPNGLLFQVFEAACDVVVADFNRDGFEDLVVADNGNNRLVRYLGPDFIVAQPFQLPAPPRHLEVVDRNRDGWPDLLVAMGKLSESGGAGFRLVPGSSAGFTQSQWVSSLPLAPQTQWLVSDFNLDGTRDVVVAGNWPGASSVAGVLDTGGEFGKTVQTAPINDLVAAAACYDDDGDGDDDLFVATTTSVVRIPNLTPHRAVSSTLAPMYSGNGLAPEGAACFAAADFNRDGRMDVVTVSAGDGKMRVFTQSGNNLAGVVVADLPGCRWVATGDIDGDGDVDIVAPSLAQNRIVWYENNGSGGGWAPRVIPVAVAMPMGVAVADLNQDGTPDIVTSSVLSSSVVMLANGQGGQSWQSTTLASVAGVIRIEVADVVPGQRPEVLLQHGSQGRVTMLRHSAGAWNSVVIADDQSGTGGDGLAVADLDGNGLLDVVFGFYHVIYAAFQTSAGTFDPPVMVGSSLQAWYALPGIVRSVRTADLDLDGRPDCIGVFDKGILVFSLDRPGDRPNRAPVLVVRDSVKPQSDVAVAAIDGDAVPDIFHREADGSRLVAARVQAPVVTVAARAANPLAVYGRYPVQGQTEVPLMRWSAAHWGWPGDAPVRLDSVVARFRRDEGAHPPLDAASLGVYFESFRLYEDVNLIGTLERGTFDPMISGVTAAAPDTAGRSRLTLASGLTLAAGTTRELFLSGMVNLPPKDSTVRVDMPWTIDGPMPEVAAMGNTAPVSAVAAMTTTETVRFLSSMPTTRQLWRNFYFNSPADLGWGADLADPDGDGLPNILEYALGLNPKKVDAAAFELGTGFDRFLISFWCAPVQPDVELKVFSSSNFKSWTARAHRQADGSWIGTGGAIVTPGAVKEAQIQQVFSTPRVAGGGEIFWLEARELAP